MEDQAMMIMTILNILSLKLILKIFKIILTLPPNKWNGVLFEGFQMRPVWTFSVFSLQS